MHNHKLQRACLSSRSLTLAPATLFAQKTLWTTGNARTLAAGNRSLEYSAFSDRHYDKLEMSVSPLAGLTLVPNIRSNTGITMAPG